MIDFRPDQIANLIQRSPEFASVIKKRYPELVPDVVSFVLNPDCSCKKRIIRFAKKKNTELTEVANTFLEENEHLEINLEAVFKNQPIEEKRVRQEMDLTPEQVAFLQERKKRVEAKRALKHNVEAPEPAPVVRCNQRPVHEIWRPDLASFQDQTGSHRFSDLDT